MNTNIALGVQPIKIPDQMEGYQKALTMAALLGQQDLQGLQIGDARRKAEKASRFQRIGRESGGNLMTMRDLLAQSGDMEEMLALDKEISARGTADFELTQKKSKYAQEITAGFLSLPPEQQAVAYPQFAATWKSANLPNSDKVPDQFDPSFLPHLQMIAQNGIAPKDMAERADYAATVPQGKQGTTMSAHLQPVPQDIADPVSGAEIRTFNPAEPQGVPIAENEQPPVEVNAKKPAGMSPDEMRAMGDFAASKGTEAGNKVAKDWYDRANQLEQRIIEEEKLAQSKRTHEEQVNNRTTTQAQKTREFENKLGDDFKSEEPVKRYRKVQPLISSMEEASRKDTAGSDLNMVYAIASIFDPDSVVREGEQIMVRNAGGLPSVVQSALGFVVGGQRLSPSLRAELLAEGRSRAGALQQAHDSLAQSYRRQAIEQELNPNNVVRTYDVKPKGPKGEGPRGAGSGTKNDPFKIKGEDGYSQVPSGAFYTDPEGHIRQKR